jgi:hypothetical protein
MCSSVLFALLAIVCLTSTAVHALDVPEAHHLLLRAGLGRRLR